MAAGIRRIGVAVGGQDARDVVGRIQRLEDIGIQAAWLTTGGAGRDGLTVFAAAAVQTQRIMMGTSIIPLWPRHPVAVAQQVRTIAELAPGRFRLGVGPSHRAGMERLIGTDFQAPLGHLREYVQILKALLQKGQVDFEGRYYHAHASTGIAFDVPVMASALRKRSFQLCGEEADGAITWVCPAPYLKATAAPALGEGARAKGREMPPLIAHTPVCVHDDPEEARAAMREQMGAYPANPFYTQMLVEAGFPEVEETKAWNDRMIDAVLLHGDEDAVERKLRDVFAIGATEVIVSPVVAGADRQASMERTLHLLGRVSAAL
ncbi:MAG: LLM class flavin-dependent oxidoreductase [Chloroflexi bacterium]|nr:LLM class flavin-dependent oxidoreductase [Chloroflexota bacterium]